MKRIKRYFAAFLALALLLSAIVLSEKVLMPQRNDYGSTWKGYLQENRNSDDVLFFGSSLAYCDIIPAVIWQRTGITSYVMAGPEQTIPLSYYYIKEACRTQSPSDIFLEATGMFYNKYQNYTKVNIGYMPWSVNRLEATFNAAEKQEIAGLLFPPYNYHSRIFEITMDDVRAAFSHPADLLAGYTLMEASNDPGELTYRNFQADEENYQLNLDYIGKISAFCKDNDINLHLYIAPAKSRIPAAMLEKLKSDAKDVCDGELIDFNDYIGKMNIDDSIDWYDSLHFNVLGGEKFSAFLADYMKDNLSIALSGSGDSALWQQRADYIAQRKAQMS